MTKQKIKKSPNQRQRQKEETRRSILKTAYALFEEKGYQKTTMRELAARAGVSVGAVFLHYQDKRSLLVASFLEDLSAVTRKSFQTMPDAHIKDQLLHLVRRYYQYYAAKPMLSRTLVKEGFFLFSPWGDAVIAELMAFLGRVDNLLAKAVDRGDLPEDINRADAVLAFWSFYITCLMWGLREDNFNPEIHVQTVGRLLDQHFQFTKDRPRD